MYVIDLYRVIANIYQMFCHSRGTFTYRKKQLESTVGIIEIAAPNILNNSCEGKKNTQVLVQLHDTTENTTTTHINL